MLRSRIISNPELLKAVDLGLSGEPKSLPSWLFYDETGDALFQQIMSLPEYYPTRCELEIIQRYKEDILQYSMNGSKSFRLIELGAGDGTKTEILLDYFTSMGARFSYLPVDISKSVLRQLRKRLTTKMPGLDVHTIASEYFDALQHLGGDEKNFVLFLGANIGNFAPDQAISFLSRLAALLKPEDLMMIGFDLKKSPRIVAQAYDDELGVTRQFNLNMLRRLNKELDARFVVHQFDHAPVYNPQTGAAESFLISLADQFVEIPALGKTYHFYQWEAVHTEISQKYDLLSLQNLLSKSDLEIVDLFFDHQQYFCDVVVKRK